MRLYYGKITAVALATFLMVGTNFVHAGRNFGDVRFQFAKEDNNLKPDLTGLNRILGHSDSITIKNYTDTLSRMWVDKQNNTYINQGTFMDILMENINFNVLSLDASKLRETSQFRAILKGMCKSVGIEESNTIWQSIGTLDDKTASLWFQAMIAARSKDQTFFSSYFNLTNLDLSYTNITDVDVSKNTALEILNLSLTRITDVDVTQNLALTNLNFYLTPITDLDVSKNLALTNLNLACTKLRSLDVSKNTALTYLNLSHTNITDVDVSKNSALKNLKLSNTNITDVDVSKNSALEILNISYNQITKVDVTQNLALTNLNLSHTNITNVDVSKNLALISTLFPNPDITK